MARKIRFRQKRLYNLKIVIILMVFLLTLMCGLFVVDINKSYMIYGKPEIEIFKINTISDNNYEIIVLNDKFNLNLKYLVREFNSVKSVFR